MQLDFTKNHFEIFGLNPGFRIDTARLEQAFREVQATVHPDRFAAGSDAEKRLSMQWATRANEAYQTLKRPLARARYLLSLQGVDTEEESNTSMPADFLLAQLEWRETVAEARVARDAAELERVELDLRTTECRMLGELDAALANASDLPAAALLVRKLRFIEKLAEEIGDAHEVLDR